VHRTEPRHRLTNGANHETVEDILQRKYRKYFGRE
jgi:hypothetical protein